ncbi:MAG: rRNA maturation RNase YbeY [Alphaproteobacteria bacterium HGW-Alphaproteobacteria-18]|nr:MAG: rRNA maturation RNase YbeY [Alphaproteobacteria bacterium HGW-Alphaproteobacteria-18]
MISFDLIVEDDSWAALGDLEALCRKAFEAAGSVAPVAEGNIALLLADDAALHQLNLDFRSKDKPTDVLSFPSLPMDRPFLGDIAIAWGVSASDAKIQGKGLDAHLVHLLIHGYLHLLGYDHETDDEAAEMEALEIKALASLDIANPYLTDC